MKKIFTLTLFFCFSLLVSAQRNTWVDVRETSNNFYEIQNAFLESYRGVDLSTVKGWKQYKRWEYYNEMRTYPHGNLAVYRQALVDHNANWKNNPASRTTSSNWVMIGPNTIPTSGGGAGRINNLKKIPNTTNQFMIASSGGGVWKYDGSNWSTGTDFLTRLGFADVVIHPTNTNIMYAASGDNDNSDAPCFGMFKSTDGGVSWNASGLGTITKMYKLLINPANPDILLVSTNSGIYRTVDAGANWIQVSGETNIRDMEFKPGDPAIVFAAKMNSNTILFRSTDGGASFSSSGVGTGLPTSNNARAALAVTDNDPNYIYMVVGATNNGFKGVYRSTDGGVNWSTQSTSPNLLGWSNTGGDTGGQQWYDLAIAASPVDKELIVVGGVNVWRSQNGGVNWTIAGHWTGSGAPYVHADIHDLVFDSNGLTVYTGCDGGIFKKDDITNSDAWADLSSGLAIAQMYRMGQSTQSQDKVITGWQDNGSSLWTGPNTWRRVIGGDGMECMIDYSTDQYQYGTIYYGRISRSSNGGANFSVIVQSGGAAGTVNEDGDWVTPYVINPRNPASLYVGKTRIYKSVDRGTNWEAHPLIGVATSKIDAIAIAPSDTNVIYASKSGQIWRSDDNGVSYNDASTGLPGLFITYIAVDESDPMKVYVTLSGTSSGQRVYMSTNGGAGWASISTGLPAISANTIVLDTTSAVNAMYVGMDAGVYYRDDNSTAWAPFNTNLPNVEITELEIQYAAQKIRAVSYGRGLWESNLESSIVNFLNASFTSSTTNVCKGATVQFNSTSTGNPAPNTYSWTFPGGTPSSSTLSNPVVTYYINGSYGVTLTVGNGLTTNTITANNYITVTSVLPAVTITGNTEICEGAAATFVASGSNLGSPIFTWTVNGASAGTNSSIFTSNTLASGSQIKVNVVSTAACAQPNTAESNIITLLVKPVPPKPVITAQYGLLTSSNPTGNQWMLYGVEIPGATGQTYLATSDGSYTVKTTINGCTSETSSVHNVRIENLFKVYPVPTPDALNVIFYVPEDANKYVVRIVSSNGQVVYREEGTATAGVITKVYPLDRLASGTYQLRIIAGSKTYNRTFIKATH